MRFFDLHSDTPYVCFEKNMNLNDIRLAATPEKAGFLSRWRQCFAVFVPDCKEDAYGYYKSVLNGFKAKIYNVKNLKIYYTLEGASLVESTERAEKLKSDGIRAVTLTWNGENKIAGGINSDRGLSEFGREIIEVFNKNKICCDLSHLNRKSFFDVLERAEYPLASHSNCDYVCHHPRNLDDDRLRLISEREGIIGLCFYPEFLKGDVFESIYQNIYHLCDMGFEDNIAIGSDFDGALMDKRLDGIDKLPKLFYFLKEKGLNEDLIDKIFYRNALKFFDKTEDIL